ncbi:MAG: 30S ribosomal protein S5 [bacterium]
MIYQGRNNDKTGFREEVLQIKRVSKKTKGGNRISFTALVITGDADKGIGIGKGRAKDVNSAIKKAVIVAKNNIFKIELGENTIPHEVSAKFKSVQVLLKPAPKGAGIIAGGTVRPIAEIVGIKDLSAKIIGSSNKEVCAYATLKALRSLVSEDSLKGKTI